MTAYSVISGLSSTGKFKLIASRPKLFNQITDVFNSGFIYLMIAIVVVVFSLVFDTGEFDSLPPIINVCIFIFVLMKLIGCFKMLDKITSLASQPSTDRIGPDKRYKTLDQAQIEDDDI